MTWIEIARIGALAVGMLSALWFCVRYHRRTHGTWRDTPYGVHMMVFSGCFVGYFAFAIVSVTAIPPDLRPYFGTPVLLSISALFWWRTRLLRDAQREPADARRRH